MAGLRLGVKTRSYCQFKQLVDLHFQPVRYYFANNE